MSLSLVKGRLCADRAPNVYCQIASHLEPLDLLHLARSSTILRTIVLSRHNVSVWKAALRNVDNLPACPIDMSEPQYAALVFDRHCFVSGERGCWNRNIEKDFFFSSAALQRGAGSTTALDFGSVRLVTRPSEQDLRQSNPINLIDMTQIASSRRIKSMRKSRMPNGSFISCRARLERVRSKEPSAGHKS